MKKISLLLTALFSLGLSQGYAQALKTVRTYYDLFSTRPYEVYTVNARTGRSTAPTTSTWRTAHWVSP